MANAAQIMQKKGFIKAELDRRVGQAQSDALWQSATQKLESILEQYASLPEGVHKHTDSRIFPSAAIYLTLKDVIGPETAYEVIENGAIETCRGMAAKLKGMMRIPGIRGLFVRIWDPLTKKIFGASCGFNNTFYPKEKGAYRMDVTARPYFRYYTELGCPELTKISCENDERIYGNLPGIEFRRTGTLGKGAKRCDFYIRKV